MSQLPSDAAPTTSIVPPCVTGSAHWWVIGATHVHWTGEKAHGDLVEDSTMTCKRCGISTSRTVKLPPEYGVYS